MDGAALWDHDLYWRKRVGRSDLLYTPVLFVILVMDWV